MSFLQNQADRMYKNRVESIRETGDCNKKIQEKLVNITAESNSFEKVQHYQDLNKDIQYIPNKDLTQ